MKKWRDFKATRTTQVMYWVISHHYHYRLIGNISGRLRCLTPECAAKKRFSASFDLGKCISYCHICRKSRDPLGLMADALNCSLNDAYDAIETFGNLRVDRTPIG